MNLALRLLGLGFGITAAIFALFLWLGPWFFLDGRRPLQLNFTAGAVLGLLLGMLIHHVLHIPRKAAAQAMAVIAVPGMLIMAAVGSHFAVFFPRLDPALDKVFGSLMLWFYGFALAGALWVARRP
jgi:tetrahydromethanopterin S-methyltransferase subunit C